MAQRFEWDSVKAASNVRKHGISFEIAQRVFADPLVETEQDRIKGGEVRWKAVGSAGGVGLIVVAHTVRENGEETIRIISARRATRTERRKHERQDG